MNYDQNSGENYDQNVADLLRENTALRAKLAEAQARYAEQCLLTKEMRVNVEVYRTELADCQRGFDEAVKLLAAAEQAAEAMRKLEEWLRKDVDGYACILEVDSDGFAAKLYSLEGRGPARRLMATLGEDQAATLPAAILAALAAAKEKA